jgi:hypothetical protein
MALVAQPSTGSGMREVRFAVDSPVEEANSSLNPNSLVTGKNTGIFIVGASEYRLVARNPEPNSVIYDPIPYASEQGSYFGLSGN